MTDSFVHCHTHTSHSLLDGASKIKDLVKAAKDDGMPALAISDHGTMSGTIEAYKECQKQGIKFIPGIELYCAKDSVDDRPQMKRKATEDDGGGESEKGEKLYYHMTALAETNAGYHNLMKLSSRAYLEGFYRRPRIDWDMMSDHSEGVIVTTGCLGGLVLQDFMKNDYQGGLEKAARLQDIFGRDNLFVELQDHGIAEQTRTNPMLMQLSQDIGAPLLACQDSHYVHQEDALAHDALICAQTGSKIADENRFRFEGTAHWFKGAAEMRTLFHETPDACNNTLWIAERSNVEIEFGKIRLPQFPVPEKYVSAEDYLRALVFGGAKKRWGFLSQEQSQRLNYELSVIDQMGFAPYFLVVWDLTRFAREQGIRIGPSRGSLGGCATFFCLGVSQLDPMKYGLPFEAFLSPERASTPDADIDISPRGRDKMINYCAEKYGEDHVAQIITFNVIKARSAVKDASRVMGYPFEFSNVLSKAMPPALFGKTAPIEACLEYDDKWSEFYEGAQGLRDLYKTDPDAKQVIDVAMGLEGLIRSDSLHAAGILISDEPMMNIVPVQRRPKKGEITPIASQYEMHAVEDLGLLKMDFLGLRNLDVITDTLAFLQKDGINLDLDRLPLDDPATFETLRHGDTVGTFQLEGKPMRDLLIRLQPTKFEDIAAVIALYRPGPMAANMHNDYADRKNGRQEITYFHPDAAGILASTYGIMCYQEEIVEITQKFAGYTFSQADLLRKAIGKKNAEAMAAEKDRFIDGCVSQGYGLEFGQELFKIIEKFADYSFRYAHALGYGLTSYHTVYLKTNYPTQYMAALIDSVRSDRERAGIYIAEARRMGLEILCPDVNDSDISAKPLTRHQSVRVGLSGLSGIGDSLASKIVLERHTGAYQSISDFCARNLENGLTRRSFTPLVQAGAFDSFGYPRKGLIAVQDQILKNARKNAKQTSQGVMTLFDTEQFAEYTDIQIPDIEFTDAEKLDAEQEAIGLFISGHPLDSYSEWFHERVTHRFADCVDVQQYGKVVMPGLVRAVKEIRTRKGDKMCSATVDDGVIEAEIIVFPEAYKQIGHLIKPGFKGAFFCRVSEDIRSGDGKKTIAVDNVVAVPVLESKTQADGELRIYLPKGKLEDDITISRLKGVLLSHRGTKTVKLYTSPSTFMELPTEYNVRPSLLLKQQLKKLFVSTDK